MNAFSGPVITRAAPDQSVRERLRKAGRELAQSVVAQRAAVQTLQDNLAALEDTFDKLENKFRDAHDTLGASLAKPVGQDA